MSDLPDTELPETPEGEAPVEQPQHDPAAEAEAAKYGWKPKDQFTRDPDGWVDAGRFLELPATQLKVSRDIQRELKKQNEDALARAERAERMATTVADKIREQEKAAYEARLADITREQRAAAEVADLVRFDALAQQRDTLKAPEPVAEVAKAEATHLDPAVEAYKAANEWTKDQTLWQLAVDAVQDNPRIWKLPTDKQLAFAERSVRAEYPERFTTQPAPTVTKVDGGGLGGAFAKTYANRLPPEALKAGQDFVKQKVFANIEEYAKEYIEGNML